MMLTRSVKKVVALAALSLGSISCGDVARSGRAPVYLTVELLQARAGSFTSGALSNILQSDVLTNSTIFADGGLVTLGASLKDITSPTGPTTNNAVTIKRYRVRYRRTDGRNTQGVDVPWGFDGAITGTLAAGGSLGLQFELVRHVAKEETPLIQLRGSPVGTGSDRRRDVLW